MLDDFYNAVTELYNYTNKFMPEYESNPCEKCNICCGKIATLGVSDLEFDYIEETLKRENKNNEPLLQFKSFVSNLSVGKNKEVCPFFCSNIKGCLIHTIRPMSCRTFGCFIGESMLDLIPDKCLLKKDVLIYNDSNFQELMPFIHPFYSLIEVYKKTKFA